MFPELAGTIHTTKCECRMSNVELRMSNAIDIAFRIRHSPSKAVLQCVLQFPEPGSSGKGYSSVRLVLR
jgi:hypothetical protein